MKVSNISRLGRFDYRLLTAIGLAAALPSLSLANPVDKLLPANSALIELGETPAEEDHVEVSLLQDANESISIAVGDLPSILTSEKPVQQVTPKVTELLQQRFENGKIHVERYVTEDADGNLINHGPYKEYDSAGTLARSGSFALGKLDGKWFQIISTDKAQALSAKMDPGFKSPFMSEATFVDGVLNGDWTIADSKGNAVFQWQFQNGKRENVSTWFDSRRVKILEMIFSDGVPHGPSTQLESGQREPKTIVYEKGRVIQPKTNWYEKGKKRSEETLLAPATVRIVSHDWWSSTVVTEPLPGDRVVRQGPYRAWHPNGQQWIESNFSDGAASGEFQRWYPNGQLESRGYFEGGEPLGEWTSFHPNGMKKMQGSYENGVQIGQWSSWNAEGRIELRAPAADFPEVQQRVEIETANVIELEKGAPASAASTAPRPVSRAKSLRRR